MRYSKTDAPPRERVPFHLRGPRPLRVALSMTFASLIALVPAVAITSPAQAEPDFLTIAAESGTEGSAITFSLDYTGVGAASYTITTTAVDAIAGTDYVAAPSALTVDFAGGQESRTVAVTTLSDTLYENDEKFTLTATAGNESDTTSGTIEDNDPQPTYQLTTPSPVSENAGGVSRPTRITATLSAISGLTAVIPLRTFDGSATSAYPHPDFGAVNTTLTISAGQETGFIDVDILDDARNEDALQSFRVGPSTSPQETTPLTVEAGVVTVEIADNDPLPTVTIGGAGAVVEGFSLGFPLTLTAPSEKVVKVDVTTSDGSATAAKDYTALSNLTIDFPPETTGRTAAVPTTADSVYEVNPETLSATLSNPQNALLGTTRTESGGLTDDDPAPTVALSPLTAAEGDTAEATTAVVATLSAATEVPVEIAYNVAAGTATDATDFMSGAGIVRIPVGATTGTIPVEITGDTMDEPDETLVITISSPNMSISNASVGTKTFTITDDDNMPTYTVGDLSVDEGRETGVMRVPVTLSNPSAENIDFVISSGNDSDTAVTVSESVGSDDYDVPGQTLRISSGGTEGFIDVTVNGDDVFEWAETASFGALPASGEGDVNPAVAVGGQHTSKLTLTNDDKVPTLAFNETTGTEGTIVRMAAEVIGWSQYPIYLNLQYFAYGDNAAGPGDLDPMEVWTEAIIGPGDSGIPLGYLFLEQDTIDEPVESFVVIATEAGTDCGQAGKCLTAKATKLAGTADTKVTAGIAAPSRIGFEMVEGEYYISDDPGDVPPTGSIADESIVENEGSVDLTVELAFNGTTTSTQQAFTVPWWTEDGSATAGLDFMDEADGVLTIPAGAMSGTINVKIVNDKLYERNEQFAVRIGDPGPAGATVGRSVAEVTIQSDDDPAVPTMLTPASIKGPGVVAVTGVTSPGATVELMLGTFGTTTALVRAAEVMADSSGRYSFTRRISAATRFGVRVEGLNSIPRNVRIVQVPTVSVTSGAKGVVTASVLSNPKMAGQIVYLQRLNAGKWVSVAKGKTGIGGYYSKTQSGFRSGTSWSFRAYIVGSTAQGTMSAHSTAKRVTVR